MWNKSYVNILSCSLKVGHVEELDIDPQRTLFRKTLSLKPALFGKYISEQMECDDFSIFIKNVLLQKQEIRVSDI